MVRYRSIPVIAIRRMLGNWRLLLSVIVGTVVAATILSSTVIYSDAIRDLGLEFAVAQESPSDLDLKVLQSTQGVDRVAYQRSRARVDSAVAAALGPATGGQVRMGSSATFFPAEPGERFPEGDDRPRAFFRFRSEFEDHINVVRGRFPAGMPDAGEEPIPVAIGLETAEANGIDLGRRFDLFPFWDEEAEPVQVEVVGIIEGIEDDERYRAARDDLIDRRTRSWPTYALLVPEATFFGALPQAALGVQADFDTLYTVTFSALNSRNAPGIARALSALRNVVSATETRVHMDSGLPDLLDTYDQKLFFTRMPLFVLMLQIGGIVAYYLVMVSTMLVERQAGEIALLRSRGATTAQLLAQYSIEGLLLSVTAALAGPPIAATAIALLGPTPAFDQLSGGELLEVNVSGLAYLLAAGGALLAFAALMLPAWRVTHKTIVEFKHASARPRPTPAFLRYYLDVALVLVSAVVFWQLSRQEELFTESLFGEVKADPFLLLTPAVFLLTVGIVFLRLFPVILRVVAIALGWTRSTAVLVGMRSLVRNPTHYTRLILLLMFATGVGMFGASFSATLDRSYRDRAAYAVGADVRASEFPGRAEFGEQAFREAASDVPAEVASPAIRTFGLIETIGGRADVDILGIDPETFREVGFFRSDFSDSTFDEMLDVLAANDAVISGIALPGDARQIGMWIKTPDLRGPVSVGVTVSDADGKYRSRLLVERIVPNDVTSDRVVRTKDGEQELAGEWRFVATDLSQMRFSGDFRDDPLTPPLTLHNVFLSPMGSIARSQGTVLLGALLTTAAPPPAPPEEAEEGEEESEPVVLREEAFPAAELVHDFATTEGWEVIQGYSRAPVGDRAVADADAPPGFGGSTRYSWTGAPRGSPLIRGLRLQTDGEPVALFLLARTAADLELNTGDGMLFFVGQTWTPARLAGVFDYFPTATEVLDGDSDGFAVANLGRLLAVVNAAPSARPTGSTEVWYAASDPAAVRTALESNGLRPRELLDVESETLLQQEDPLVAAGWQGILSISFGAVLLLSAIGFLVYAYLTAQQRVLEFAILRTLGFSRPQIFGVVAFEHIFVIAAGMGLGTVVGLQLGRMMMDLLGTDERGEQVLPPFLLGVTWPEVFITWGILGVVFVFTIGAVVLLYWRLQVHRALRIGDA